MHNNIVIHHNNIDLNLFSKRIKFLSTVDVDSYISTNIINQLVKKDFEVIFIKDNLSSNYLELLGLRVAYHIRLSTELGEKRYLPIVILSDINSHTLNLLEPMANILFTKNIFIISNTKEAIKEFYQKDIAPLTKEQYRQKFLDKIIIEKTKDTSGNHDIANKWSIYKWSDSLKVESETVDQNNAKIKNMLYFKYLKAKSLKKEISDNAITTPTKKGKVLLIDDEWDAGWSDILIKIFASNQDINFETFEYDYKDKTNFNLIVQLKYKALKEQISKSDVVILDLRLLNSDHENEDMDNFSGIKILKKIHEINAGIQVIMLTATSKSTILEKLYEYKILGYIKKEHPDDKNISTIENINKFIRLVDEGLNKKYLKTAYEIKSKISNILQNDIFSQYVDDIEHYKTNLGKLHKENSYIFDILNNENNNKFNYAMVSIATSLEAIISILLYENSSEVLFWDKERAFLNSRSRLEDKITKILEKLGNTDDIDLSDLIKHRNSYMHSNKKYREVTKENIIEWFEKLLQIFDIIANPPNYIKYDKKNAKLEENIITPGGLRIKSRIR